MGILVILGYVSGVPGYQNLGILAILGVPWYQTWACWSYSGTYVPRVPGYQPWIRWSYSGMYPGRNRTTVKHAQDNTAPDAKFRRRFSSKHALRAGGGGHTNEISGFVNISWRLFRKPIVRRLRSACPLSRKPLTQQLGNSSQRCVISSHY